MILGSHNTCSYKNPKNIVTRVCKKMSKCQNEDIDEQYEIGCRCFDFRIRFKKGKTVLCHGLSEYSGDLISILDSLNKKDQNLYIRVAYENIFNSNDYQKFIDFGETLKTRYPGFKFQFCKKQPKWTVIENNFDKQFVEIQNSCHTLKELINGPEYYKYDQLEKFDKWKDKDVIISMDFVEIVKDRI